MGQVSEHKRHHQLESEVGDKKDISGLTYCNYWTYDLGMPARCGDS